MRYMQFPVVLSPKVLKKAEDLSVHPADIIEHFVRGSGKGGQKINKTSSVVVLYHVPSQLRVRVQQYREQSKNRVLAYKLLIEKIEDMVKGRESEKAQKIFKLRKQKKRRSKKAKEKMLLEKRKRSEIKQMRKSMI